MKYNIEKTKQVIFINDDQKLVINVDSIEKLDSIINEFHFLGHVGEENCSGADVGVEFRSVPNKCKKDCCNL